MLILLHLAFLVHLFQVFIRLWIKNKILSLIKDAEAVPAHFTTDIWTLCTSNKYLSLTAHYVTFQAQSIGCCTNDYHALALLVGEITAANILHFLQFLLNEWTHSNKLTGRMIITDNGVNMRKAALEGSYCNIHYFAHALNLTVHNTLEDYKTINRHCCH